MVHCIAYQITEKYALELDQTSLQTEILGRLCEQSQKNVVPKRSERRRSNFRAKRARYFEHSGVTGLAFSKMNGDRAILGWGAVVESPKIFNRTEKKTFLFSPFLPVRQGTRKAQSECLHKAAMGRCSRLRSSN